MSSERRHRNPGKREREARKRHRRALIWCSIWGAEAEPLKRGSRHFRRGYRHVMAVADSRKTGGERALESARRSLPEPF